MDDKQTITALATLTVPIGGQSIELQQLDFAVGGMSLLRTRIREGKRFTVFDIDTQTASDWGKALLDWAEAQRAGSEIAGSASGDAVDRANGTRDA